MIIVDVMKMRLQLVLAGLALSAAVAVADATPPLRRVVLISCDTLRSASLPCYGNQNSARTVGLDSLASAGALFLHCVTPVGWTLAAHAAMFTGLDPGVTRVGVEHALPTGVPLLTQRLADAGFVCGGFPASNQWLEPRYGFGRGFRQYRFQAPLAPITQWTRHWDLGDDLLAHARTASYFLFFHFMDTHTVPVDFDHRLPYWAIREFDRYENQVVGPYPEPRLTDDGRWDLAAYDPTLLRQAYLSAVTSLDFLHLRPLLHHMRDTGLADDAMIVVTADHGEEIAEHGGTLHDSPYAEVRDVPLLVVWPGVVPAGKVVYAPVSILDIAPTILDYAALPAPDPCQGVSLRPLLGEGFGALPARDFLVDGDRRGLALRRSALLGLQDDTWWSLVATTDTSGCVGTFAPARADSVCGLYDLDRDPAEATDVQGDHPAVVAALRARFDAALAREARLAQRVLQGQGREAVRLNDDERRKLRALGY